MVKDFFSNRQRLLFKNQFKLILFLFKRQFKIRNTPEWYGLKEFFLKLIKLNGVQTKEDKSSYYFKLNHLEVKLRKRPASDLSVFCQVFEEAEYKTVLNSFTSSFKSEPINIIDAGSNVGLTSLYFHEALKTTNIIAIEPDDNNFDVLKYNIDKNKVNATLLKAGLWSNTTYLKIVNDFRDKKEWATRVEETENEGLRAVTINSLLTDYKWDVIDILKIDIEGAEKETFTSSKANVSFLSKTKCIAIEIHDEFNCREEINAILKQYHFKCFNSGELTIGINQKLLP